MPDLSILQFDVVTNMMSLCVAAMFAGGIFLLFSRESVAPKYRPALLISALVTFIACYHYVRISTSFVGAYTLQNGVMVDSGAGFNDAYRYADWLLTVPLLVIELIAVCALAKAVSQKLMINLGVASLVMIALGYPGEVASASGSAWLWWGLAMVPFLYIIATLFGSFNKAIVDQPANVRPLISKARALILITWSFYPVAYLLPWIGLSGGAGETALQVGYTIADITAKVGLGVYIYFIARAKSEADGFTLEGTPSASVESTRESRETVGAAS
ncbi:MAG: bacteriorhodopsin-like [Planctomycetota bacterium]